MARISQINEYDIAAKYDEKGNQIDTSYAKRVTVNTVVNNSTGLQTGELQVDLFPPTESTNPNTSLSSAIIPPVESGRTGHPGLMIPADKAKLDSFETSGSYATKVYVDALVAANDAMKYRGVINSNSEIESNPVSGWTYKIGTRGTYAGFVCEVGDLLIYSEETQSWERISTNAEGVLYKGPTYENNKFLMSDESEGSGAVKTIALNPYVVITSGDSSNAPSVSVDLMGDSENAGRNTLGIATSSLYGVTKLSDSIPSGTGSSIWTNNTTAATPSLIKGAMTSLINDLAAETISTTLYASGWSNSLYTISNPLFSSTSNQIIVPSESTTKAMYDAMGKAKIIGYGQTDGENGQPGTITLKALGTVPTSDIYIDIVLLKTSAFAQDFTPSSGGGSGAGVFIISLALENDTYTANKTWAQIQEAFLGGQHLVVRYNNKSYNLSTYIQGSSINFINNTPGSAEYFVIDSTGSVTNGTLSLDAEDINYTNESMENVTDVKGALDYLYTNQPDGGGNVDSVDNVLPDENKNVTLTRELTIDEYTSLSEAAQKNGITYFITDANEEDPPLSYSTFTLFANNWNSATKTYTITDNRITLNSVQTLSPAIGISSEQLSEWQNANIQDYSQSDGSITIKAYDRLPTINIPIRVVFKSGFYLKPTFLENAIFSINTSGWDTTGIEINEVTYYTYTINVSSIIDTNPIIGIAWDGIVPTEDEQDAYNTWNYAVTDDEASTITLYSKAIPENNFKILIKGIVA